MIGQRIQRARKALGLSLRDLAIKLELSHAAIKKYEDNQVTPSSDVLLKLAKVLQVHVEYFFRPEGFTLENIQYRQSLAHGNIPKSQLHEIQAFIYNHIERRIELENLFPQPLIQLFSFVELYAIKHKADIENIAASVRATWELGLGPIHDLIDTFEAKGIKVFELDNRERFSKFDGLSAFVNGMPVIIIGKHWPGDRQRFTLAHELGHILLAKYLPKTLNEEDCCNRFAGAFLLPAKILYSLLGTHRNSIEVRELSLLKKEFGISMSAILHRAQDLNIISNNLYTQLRSQFKEQGWLHTEPGDEYPREKSLVFEQMIFHALAEEYIGESKAAELMNIATADLRALRTLEPNWPQIALGYGK